VPRDGAASRAAERSMRYSFRGSIGLGQLEAVLRQYTEDLADHDVDEVLGLSL
jgi:hypothetical protein